MSFLSWFSRRAVNPEVLARRVIHAMFRADMPRSFTPWLDMPWADMPLRKKLGFALRLFLTLLYEGFRPDIWALKRLVSPDVTMLAIHQRGLLPERDGFLQFVNGLRRSPPRWGPPRWSEITQIEIETLSAWSASKTTGAGAAMYVYVHRQMGGWGDETTVREFFFSWTMHFSRYGKLVHLIVEGADQDSPVELSEEHVYRSVWGRLCNFAGSILRTIVRLRAPVIVTSLFAALMLLPRQSGEALRVVFQDQGQAISLWEQPVPLIYTMTAFTMAGFVYGFVGFTVRRINETSPTIGALQWTIRHFTLLGILLAFWTVLWVAALWARRELEAGSEGAAAAFGTTLILVASCAIGLLSVLDRFGQRMMFRVLYLRSKSPRRLALRFMFVLTAIAAVCYLVYWRSSPVPDVFIIWSTLALAVLGWLVWASTRTRIPWVFLAFAVPLVLSWTNRNDHNLIRCRDLNASQKSCGSADTSSTSSNVIWAPADMPSTFRAWVSARRPGVEGPLPLFIVAAEGGGLRAAVMTAMVLDELRARYDSFTSHLFAIVGVSGGSVGAASFAAALHGHLEKRTASASLSPSEPARSEVNWHAALHADFLAPSVRALLGRNLLASYVPRSLADLSVWDRSRALEDAWADGWKAATGSDSLRALWFADIAPQPGTAAPYLILMTTSIQDGEPMAISHLCNFGVRTLAGISPKIDVPLRTAAIMSARFPIISSSARLPNMEPPVGFVDGGYYENSGLTATIRLIRAMQGQTNRDAGVGGDACPQTTTAATPVELIEPIPSVTVIVIRIENGAADEKQQGVGHMFEWMSPVSALYATRIARGREAAQNLGDLIHASKIECKDNKACLSIEEVRFRLAEPKVPIPLGWLLSSAARKDISDQLGIGCNAQTFKAIGAALGDGKTPELGKDCVK